MILSYFLTIVQSGYSREADQIVKSFAKQILCSSLVHIDGVCSNHPSAHSPNDVTWGLVVLCYCMWGNSYFLP